MFKTCQTSKRGHFIYRKEKMQCKYSLTKIFKIQADSYDTVVEPKNFENSEKANY